MADTLQRMEFIVQNPETQAWEFALLEDVLKAYEARKLAKKRITVVAEKLHWVPWKGDAEMSPEGDGGNGGGTIEADAADHVVGVYD